MNDKSAKKDGRKAAASFAGKPATEAKPHDAGSPDDARSAQAGSSDEAPPGAKAGRHSAASRCEAKYVAIFLFGIDNS